MPHAPTREKHPCIKLAYNAGRMGGVMTVVGDAVNEATNKMFRKDVVQRV